jgi:hypothetical protein
MTSAEARGILEVHAWNEARIEKLEAAGDGLLEIITSYQRITDGLVTALTSIPCLRHGECAEDFENGDLALCPVCIAVLRAQSVVAEHAPA